MVCIKDTGTHRMLMFPKTMFAQNNALIGKAKVRKFYYEERCRHEKWAYASGRTPFLYSAHSILINICGRITRRIRYEPTVQTTMCVIVNVSGYMNP